MTELESRHFDYLLGTRNFFRVREVAQLLELSESTVEKLIDAGQLPTQAHNGGAGKRMTHRVPRLALILYLLRTKTYPVEFYVEGVLETLDTLSFPELRQVEARLPAMLAKAAGRMPFKLEPVHLNSPQGKPAHCKTGA